jgi:UDP:flavonoid glycosyltransferase YjiC (YdhE family)
MSRYLFVFPPLIGHVNPAVAVGAELESRGHEVAWVAHDAVVGSLVGEGATIYPAGDRFLVEVIEHLPERDRLKGLPAVKFLWEKVLVPLAVDMVGPVRAAVDDFGPDVIVSDQQTFAGSIVAVERGLGWAVSACSTAELVDPVALVPKVGDWMRRKIDGLCADLGMPALTAAGFDPRYSPRLVLEYSTRALVGEVARDLPSLAFVGPVLPDWADPVPFPWEWLDRHDTNVCVSLGTLSHGIGEPFLATVLEAVAGRPYGVVMVGQAELLPPPPANVLICPFVPQGRLLPRMQAVVCHAGHNTTVQALGLGIPLVCAPIRDDQPVTAGQVARAGAGVRIRFARAKPADVAVAIDTVLHDPSYRAAAGRIAESFAAAGGAPAAARHLEALAVAPRPTPLASTSAAEP